MMRMCNLNIFVLIPNTRLFGFMHHNTDVLSLFFYLRVKEKETPDWSISIVEQDMYNEFHVCRIRMRGETCLWPKILIVLQFMDNF